MKISLNWLSNYINVSEFYKTPEKLDQILTQAGLEVESLENLGEAYKNVVIGQIIELEAHPDADRLTLCQVDVGNKDDLRSIVCGAKNHKVNDYVVVALPGAVLPGDFKIKKSKVRGVESAGMMCSASELGLDPEGQSDGIIILLKMIMNFEVGQDYSSFAGLDDIVFELNVTPNRADCLSHFGLVRELSCLLGREYKAPGDENLPEGGERAEGSQEAPASKQKATTKTSKTPKEKLISVDLKATDFCPRYSGRGVYGVQVGPSPQWLKQRLESVGVNSINNVVDVTNYVMLELGQPMHAFDIANIEDRKIEINLSAKGEKFVTLDGTELALTGDELMIRDGKKPVALAGVVGGLNSGVSESTQDIFLESAYFTHDRVRKTARKFGIDTDSAYRFSRGTDPEGTMAALDRASELIVQVAGGQLCNEGVDLYPNPIPRPQIQISKTYLEERLGYPVSMDEFDQWMKRLGCEVKAPDPTSAEPNKAKGSPKELRTVLTPPFRGDLQEEIDLVEEFARLHGYDKVPETLPSLTNAPLVHDKVFLDENRLAQALQCEGYLQTVNYNFVGSEFLKDFLGDPKFLTQVGLRTGTEPVAIRNPLNDDTNVMRSCLAPSLFKVALHNYRHGSHFGRLFEVGFCFEKDLENKETPFLEHQRLSLVGWGQNEDLWNKNMNRSTVYDLKATIENLFESLHCKGLQWKTLKSEQVPQFLHPQQSVGIFFEGSFVGILGTIHPSLKQKYKLRHDLSLAEIDVVKLMRGQPRTPKLKKISKFPSVERDIAFVKSDHVLVGDMQREIKKLGGGLLQDVAVFDVFRGGNLNSDQSSVAFKLMYQHLENTLDENQILEVQKKVIEGMEKKFSVSVR